jgi:hypothetical protein
MPAPETLILRATAIAGQRYADDYAVIWRGISVGRIMLGNGAPHDRPQWTWSCHVHGRPQGSNDRGTGADLDDRKLKFRKAWARIRASLTDQDIVWAAPTARPIPVKVRTPSKTSMMPTTNTIDRPSRGGMTTSNTMIATPTAMTVMVRRRPRRRRSAPSPPRCARD